MVKMKMYRFRLCFDIECENDDDAQEKIDAIGDELWQSDIMSDFSADFWSNAIITEVKKSTEITASTGSEEKGK